jgi:dipeptidyl aminopeptidase/acylaminoacyl peptidase
LARWGEDRSEFVLLDVDGSEVAAIRNDSSDVVGAGAGGTILTEGLPGREVSSSLISADGQRRDPVPGLVDDEWAEEALWSPDGSLLALSLRRSATEDRAIRIVEVATGVEIAEFTEPYREILPKAWSGDGRFFFYELACDRRASGLCEGPTGATTEAPPVVWVVYDTETDLTHSFSLPEGRWLMEIRTNEESPPAEELTPVEWWINIDEVRTGVHMVGTIVDVRPLTPDQVEDTSGRLIWDETVVDLCRIDIREVGPGFVHIGDIFGSDEGCGRNPTAMQDAFDTFGLPATACVAVGVAGVDHQYCAPLS